MKSLFDSEAFLEIKNRLDTLKIDNPRQWGRMTIAQMLYHCQQPLKVSLGRGYIKKQFIPFVFLLKKNLYNDKPWRKNLPTTKSFKVTEEKDFEIEKTALVKLVDEFHLQKNKKIWEPHPIFGKFTPTQWGQMQYKHLDHHLKQFGA